jgi:DNA-binding XRE family transcriptional regulator
MSAANTLIETMIQARKRRGLTQEQLADYAGISRRSLVAIENGGDCMVSTLTRLYQALDLELVAQTAQYSPPTLEDIQEENRAEFQSHRRPKP